MANSGWRDARECLGHVADSLERRWTCVQWIIQALCFLQLVRAVSLQRGPGLL